MYEPDGLSSCAMLCRLLKRDCYWEDLFCTACCKAKIVSLIGQKLYPIYIPHFLVFGMVLQLPLFLLDLLVEQASSNSNSSSVFSYSKNYK
jgi:hypothetical protein